MSTNAPIKSQGRLLKDSQPKRSAELAENPIGGRIARGKVKLRAASIFPREATAPNAPGAF
jgi:hypothetical protein